MLVFDEITIIISACVVVLAILGSLVNPFLRGINVSDGEEESEKGQDKPVVPLTVIITAHDNARELGKNLPSILGQDYPNFQVIVVAEKGEEDTEELLKRFSRDPHLYVTYIPNSSRYMSRKKLAITLGVKAAKTEWIVLTEPSLQPQSDQWLRTMSRNCDDQHNLVMGFTQYDNETSDFRHFEHLRTAYYLLRRAQRGTAVCTNMPNIAFRKSEFLEQRGFLGNLQLVRGEYDFLINKYAREDESAVETDRRAWLIEQEPTNRSWTNRHIYFMASRKCLERYTSMRILKGIDHLMPHLSLLASIAACAFGGIKMNWIVLGAGVFSLLLLYILRMIISNNAIRKFDEDIHVMVQPFYEYSMLWHSITGILRYWRADKQDFTSHKL